MIETAADTVTDAPVDTAASIELRGQRVDSVASPVDAPTLATTLRPNASSLFDNLADIYPEAWWRRAPAPLLVLLVALRAPHTDTWSVVVCAWLLAVAALLALTIQMRSHCLHIGPEGVGRESALRRPWNVRIGAIHAARIVALRPRRLLPWTRGLPAYRLLLVNIDGRTLRHASLWGYQAADVAAALNAAGIPCLNRVEGLEANQLRTQRDGSAGVLVAYSTLAILAGMLIVLLLAGAIGSRLSGG